MEFELTILAIIVGFISTLIGVIVAIGIARKQSQQDNVHLEKQIKHAIELSEKQGQQTEKIALMTSDLDAKINRLSLKLSQRIETLHRLRDVVLSLAKSNVSASNYRDLKLRGRSNLITPDMETSQYNLVEEIMKNDLEMRAIAQVINDPTLTDIILKEYDVYRKKHVSAVDTIQESGDFVNNMHRYYLRILARVYKLIEESTDGESVDTSQKQSNDVTEETEHLQGPIEDFDINLPDALRRLSEKRENDTLDDADFSPDDETKNSQQSQS